MMTYLRVFGFLLVSLRTQKRQNNYGDGNTFYFPPGVESYFLSESKHPGGNRVLERDLFFFGTTTLRGNPGVMPQ